MAVSKNRAVSNSLALEEINFITYKAYYVFSYFFPKLFDPSEMRMGER